MIRFFALCLLALFVSAPVDAAVTLSIGNATVFESELDQTVSLEVRAIGNAGESMTDFNIALDFNDDEFNFGPSPFVVAPGFRVDGFSGGVYTPLTPANGTAANNYDTSVGAGGVVTSLASSQLLFNIDFTVLGGTATGSMVPISFQTAPTFDAGMAGVFDLGGVHQVNTTGGFATLAGPTSGFISVTAVPEPSSLLACGLLACGLVVRRRRRS